MNLKLFLKNSIFENVKKGFASFMHLLYTNKKVVIFIWFLPVLFVIIKQMNKGFSNNYLIFKYVYYHTLDKVNLYDTYPDLYLDSNHYGPIFSLIIAPFALMPDVLGAALFVLCISISLCIAIYKLPVEWKYKVAIYLITCNCLFISALGNQTNPLVAALIIGAFIAIHREKCFWAACFIALGFFLKLYGIVGLAFFFFTRQKIKFVGSLVFWAVIFFVLPMFISSPEFIVQSYIDWYVSLAEKNIENANSLLQDISVMGMMRRISGNRELSNLIVLIPAVILFALQYIRTDLYENKEYRLAILASTLLMVVLFSSGSESPTYIIAMVGVGIWFILQKQPYSKAAIGLLLYALIFSSFATSDILPLGVRVFIKQYALKALPCFVVWLVLFFQILRMKAEKQKLV